MSHWWVQMLLLLAGAFGHRIARSAMMKSLRLNAEAYDGPSILLSSVAAAGPVWASALLASAAMAIGWERTAWGAGPPALWVGVGVAALTLAWATALAPFNPVFGRWRVIDRALCAALGVLVCVHPMFVPPAIAMFASVLWQYDHPRCLWYSWTHVRLPSDVLLAACAGLCVRAGLGLGWEWVFALVLGAVAGDYLAPALAKLRAHGWTPAWIVRNRTERLVVSGWCYGWLWWKNEAGAVRLARRVRPIRVALCALTMAIEVGALAIGFDARAGGVLLVALALMHAGILLASGINFWKWFAVSLAMGVTMLVAPGAAPVGPWAGMGVALLALAGPLWLRPEWLGWRDSRVTNRVRLQGVDARGQVYELGSEWFAPYDMSIAMGRLWFLDGAGSHLVGTWGCNTRRDERAGGLQERLDSCKPDELDGIRAAHGLSKPDEAQAALFDAFVVGMARARAAREPRRDIPTWLRPPRHLLTRVRGRRHTWRDQELVRVIVRATETFFDGERVHVTRDEVIREIDLGVAQRGPVYGQSEAATRIGAA